MGRDLCVKILDQGLNRGHGSWGKRAKRIFHVPAHFPYHFNVFSPALPGLDAV
jgi:hypothetical protein